MRVQTSCQVKFVFWHKLTFCELGAISKIHEVQKFFSNQTLPCYVGGQLAKIHHYLVNSAVTIFLLRWMKQLATYIRPRKLHYFGSIDHQSH